MPIKSENKGRILAIAKIIIKAQKQKLNQRTQF